MIILFNPSTGKYDITGTINNSMIVLICKVFDPFFPIKIAREVEGNVPKRPLAWKLIIFFSL